MLFWISSPQSWWLETFNRMHRDDVYQTTQTSTHRTSSSVRQTIVDLDHTSRRRGRHFDNRSPEKAYFGNYRIIRCLWLINVFLLITNTDILVEQIVWSFIRQWIPRQRYLQSWVARARLCQRAKLSFMGASRASSKKKSLFFEIE